MSLAESLAGDDVVGEDLDEGGLVLRLDERVNGAGGQLVKRFVGGREDGEGAGAFEGVDQAAALTAATRVVWSLS